MAKGSNNEELKSLVQRIESLEMEKQTVSDDIKSVYAEAKDKGFDAKILKKVIALRKRNKGEIDEEQATIDHYLAALGDLADTPLGRAAVAAEFGD